MKNNFEILKLQSCAMVECIDDAIKKLSGQFLLVKVFEIMYFKDFFVV